MSRGETSVVVLVKHAQPVLDPTRPPCEWRLGEDGEAQARRLALRLRRFLPFHLVSSPEPKARRTMEIVAADLHVETKKTVEGLRELDRAALPIMSVEDHRSLNARVFAELDMPVVGAESARTARDRFAAAVRAEVAAHPRENAVIIAHGTVISLLVAAANDRVDAFELWTRLRCPSLVVLDGSTLALREVVERV
jgi:broad specificity phosphatase PhoE